MTEIKSLKIKSVLFIFDEGLTDIETRSINHYSSLPYTGYENFYNWLKNRSIPFKIKFSFSPYLGIKDNVNSLAYILKIKYFKN